MGEPGVTHLRGEFHRLTQEVAPEGVTELRGCVGRTRACGPTRAMVRRFSEAKAASLAT